MSEAIRIPWIHTGREGAEENKATTGERVTCELLTNCDRPYYLP